MTMMVDTRIYGYYWSEGGVSCVPCFSRATDGMTHAESGYQGLFSHDDDGNGLSCDDCGEYVFEPSFELVYTSDDVVGLETTRWGGRDDLSAWTVDHEDGAETQLDVDWIDSDYGQAMAARTADGTVAAIWATPDHPQHIEGVEVVS
jgi:hypothetical protein